MPQILSREELAKKGCKEKLGILGTSATGLKDIRPTPVEDRMPGVEIHANLIDTVISAICIISSKKMQKMNIKKLLKMETEEEALTE